jgi:hypothetical protein
MRLTAEQIEDEALALPSEARALLADHLVESLDLAEKAFAQVGQAIESKVPDSNIYPRCTIKAT